MFKLPAFRTFVCWSRSLQPSSTNFTHWRDHVLLTLRRYTLTDHVISDLSFPDDPVWDRMDNIVLSCIFGMISTKLQEIIRECCGYTPRHAWLALENQFIGNRETHALHLDSTFRNIVQGDLAIGEYCRKMKGFADALSDLDALVSDHVLVLNVLWGLSPKYANLRTIITRSVPFPTFLEVRDDLVGGDCGWHNTSRLCCCCCSVHICCPDVNSTRPPLLLVPQLREARLALSREVVLVQAPVVTSESPIRSRPRWQLVLAIYLQSMDRYDSHVARFYDRQIFSLLWTAVALPCTLQTFLAAPSPPCLAAPGLSAMQIGLLRPPPAPLHQGCLPVVPTTPAPSQFFLHKCSSPGLLGRVLGINKLSPTPSAL